MYILNPVSYEDTFSALMSGGASAGGVFDVQMPGMMSLSGIRLCMACKELPLRSELIARESRQQFSAGDYFLMGSPERICVITIGVSSDPHLLESFVAYAKTLQGELVCLSDLSNEPEMETFLDVVTDHLDVQMLSLEEIRGRHQAPKASL